ncbi:MAG: iron-sulfur cluster assembly scaffold protein [Patescibacteria group bacterium]
MYRQIIIDHSRQPKNFGTVKQPDGVAERNNPLCGDRISISYRIDKTKKKLQEVKFDGAGCSIARAAASILTEKATGKSIRDLKKYSDDDFIHDMGVPITPARRKCALLALETLRQAAHVGEKK